MIPWLFYVYVDGVFLEENVSVFGKGWSWSVNGGRFEINQLLFADDIALVADSRRNCVDC